MFPDNHHEEFKGRLAGSVPVVEATIELFKAKGYPAKMGKHTVADDYKDRAQHSDDGDIKVEITVEVKGISRIFSSPDDWPFGDDVIVDQVNTFDKKYPVPYMYVCWSKDMNAYLVIKVSETRDKWRIEKRRNMQLGGVMQDFYIIDKKFCTFVSKKGKA